jgi:hypothetical protein
MSMLPSNNIRQLRRPETAGGAPAGRRLRTDWPAELTSPDGRIVCTVLDVSSRGARLSLREGPPEGVRVWLVVETIGSIAAQVIWRRDNQIGIQFTELQSWIGRLQAQQVGADCLPPHARAPHGPSRS